MKYISSKEAALKLNTTERTIRNYCIHGKITGAILKKNSWLIPEDFSIKENQQENLIYGMKDFLDNSPVSFYAIKNVSDMLSKAGYKKILETEIFNINKGDKVFFVRNNSSLIAMNIGKDITNEYFPYHIVASHSDSPCFKIKPNGNGFNNIYNSINVEAYGGMICSSWLDRPLSIAGRILVKENSEITTQLVNINKHLLIIPNLCIHFNREVNNGKSYNIATDMQPFIAESLKNDVLKEELSKVSKISIDKIIGYDLYLYNRDLASIWGIEGEYISSPRLDDLECVYTSSMAFINSNNSKAINTLYIADNEEVGSSSAQSADSDFLYNIMKRVSKCLGFNNEEFLSSVANSFLISADNAHAVHPNFPSTTDEYNKAYMNQGIVIKSNASQTYTSDAISSLIFAQICESVKVPTQNFTNCSDIRGGSTLGNILLSQVSMHAVDIGLAQLAMHSSYETAGSKDIIYMEKAIEQFYRSNIKFLDDKFIIE